MNELRKWQAKALDAWNNEGFRGIVSVVTGGGKTFFALACAQSVQPMTVLIVLPTQALLDQWWEEAVNFFGIGFDEVNVITGRKRIRSGTINLAIINTAARIAPNQSCESLLLVVDECHKAASEKYRELFKLKRSASLGLSATPERQYDDGLDDVLIPELGPIICRYTYKEALADGVIVPFRLTNIVFELEEDRQEEFDKLTRAIAKAIRKYGVDGQETVSLMLRRSRVANLSLTRVELAARLVARHPGKRTIVFHEDIAACEVLHQAISAVGGRCAVYHSGRTDRDRAQILSSFRQGMCDVLVTCRALDEGFNVPEAELGIIAASTATRRQRIQRLGRLLRPSKDKESAMVYTLVATKSEISRLREEEIDLEGVASVEWRTV